LLAVRHAALVVSVLVDPEAFPARRQEPALPASKAVVDSKAVNCKTRIGSPVIEVCIGRLSVLEARVLGNNGIPGLAIDIGMLVPEVGMQI
jgi:hypothetical protein